MRGGGGVVIYDFIYNFTSGGGVYGRGTGEGSGGRDRRAESAGAYVGPRNVHKEVSRARAKYEKI